MATDKKKAKFTAKEIVTDPCRLAFPALFVPKPVDPDKPDKLKYQAAILIDPETNLKPFYKCIKAAWVEKFGDAKFPKSKNPVKSTEDKEDLTGFDDGWHVINAYSGYAPKVVDQKRQEVIDADRVYPGCWCRFHLVAYAWSHPTGGKGVSFSLEAVQLVKDGEKFIQRLPVEDLFEPIGVEDASDMSGDDDDASDLFE